MINKTQRRNIIFSILLLILIFGLVVFIREYLKKRENPNYTFMKPRVELSFFEIKSLTKDTVDMNMNLLISNPLPVGIHLNDLDFKIYIAGVEVMHSKYGERVDIESNDSSMITFPVIVENKKLTNVLTKLETQNRDSTDYRITGTTKFKILKMSDRTYDFDITRRGPTVFIPKIIVQKFDIEKFRLKKTKAEITLEIQNPNIFPITFKNTSYELKIEGDDLVKGEIPALVNIPAKGKSTLNLPAEINLKEAISTTWDAIFKASKTDYRLVFKTVIQSPDKSVNNSKVIMVSEGNLKELKEMK